MFPPKPQAAPNRVAASSFGTVSEASIGASATARPPAWRRLKRPASQAPARKTNAICTGCGCRAPVQYLFHRRVRISWAAALQTGRSSGTTPTGNRDDLRCWCSGTEQRHDEPVRREQPRGPQQLGRAPPDSSRRVRSSRMILSRFGPPEQFEARRDLRRFLAIHQRLHHLHASEQCGARMASECSPARHPGCGTVNFAIG